MKKKLYEYFKSIEDNKRLPQVVGGYVEDGGEIRKFGKRRLSMSCNIFPYIIDGKLMCVKSDGEKFYQEKDVLEVVSGEYFNNSGVLSVMAYPLWLQESSIFGRGGDRVFGVATHDLNDIKDIDIISAKDLLYLIHKDGVENGRVWEFTEKERSFLQKIMTDKCIDEHINLHLCDRLGGYLDRHGKNFFYYKGKEDDQWQGVIAIDNGETMFIRDSFSRGLWSYMGREEEGVLDKVYKHYTIDGREKFATHKENIYTINKAIQDGVFDASNLATIKSALDFGYVEKFQSCCENYGLDVGFGDDVQRIWEYNEKTLEI